MGEETGHEFAKERAKCLGLLQKSIISQDIFM